MSIFGLLIIIVDWIVVAWITVIWYTVICIQFLFYIWERFKPSMLWIFTFFWVLLLQIFLHIGSFPILISHFFLICLSLWTSFLYSGNAIQVCPTYYWFDFSTKLPLFYPKTNFLSSSFSIDLYYCSVHLQAFLITSSSCFLSLPSFYRGKLFYTDLRVTVSWNVFLHLNDSVLEVSASSGSPRFIWRSLLFIKCF